jgi:hypothetical protein
MAGGLDIKGSHFADSSVVSMMNSKKTPVSITSVIHCHTAKLWPSGTLQVQLQIHAPQFGTANFYFWLALMISFNQSSANPWLLKNLIGIAG